MSDDIALPENEPAHTNMANAIRALSMDAVQNANSGHPGMPMGMADVATVLFRSHLRFDPKTPDWPNRDRFVLSAGHGSMLLYSLLHLTGYARPTMDDIKNFRQLHSPTAGHPEYGECPGVETTTGPLGQGLATSVGMAIAEAKSSAEFGADLFDYHTYVLAGDGCLMEGVSQEAITLAGHLKLSKLIVLWDDNSISIDGGTDLATSEDMAARFEAAGWHVQSCDGHDADAIDVALTLAKQEGDKPSLIACKTTIGFGSPNKAGTAATHGAPLGDEEIAATRDALGWPHAPFTVPADVSSLWHEAGSNGAALVADWQKTLSAKGSATVAEINRRLAGDLPGDFDSAIKAHIDALIADPKKVATRKASQMALEAINAVMPETLGGSADLTGSNLTKTSGHTAITPDDKSGGYIHYGIREFGMAAAMNGIALSGLYVPYGGTFLVFTDYARPAMRLAALMGQRAIYVMTHDSIGLGEDGPTHQPVEHVMSLRAMPNMRVFRPADVVETAECWALALADISGPSVLSLSRQGVPQVRLEAASENLSARGGYVLKDADGAKVVLVATGTEVEIALKAQDQLAEKGVAARVVSMPCTELFDAQDDAYKASVLPSDLLKVSIEAGTTFGWERYVGQDGIRIGLDSFGASAPAGDLYTHFGITAETAVDAVLNRL